MKKIFLICVILFSLLFNTACPVNKADLEKMKAQSGKIATGANAGINATRELFREGVISLETKDKIADAFIYLAEGGQFADLQIQKAIDTYGQNAPPGIKKQIVALFRSNILDRFLGVLEKLKLVSSMNRYREILAAIKTSVILLGAGLGVEVETKSALKGA